ncbi:MAG: MarR family transcriptional regulator [Actinomycetota bacterium]|nr:MarR family transcriptional regulator [Actinomycetota bacterium]
MANGSKISDEDYWRLLEFRTAIRKFLKYSKTQAAKMGLTPTQHQLLLAIRGYRSKGGPTIGDIASCLLIKHHSAVELVDRAEEAGLVKRKQDPSDQRVVRLVLTRSGASKLERISTANLAEVGRLGPELNEVWDAIEHLQEPVS